MQVVGELPFEIIGDAQPRRRADRLTRIVRRQAARRLAVPVRVIGQAGVAIDAVTLQGQPIGAQIAFLAHPCGGAPGLGHGNRRAVYGAAVVMKDDVGDAFAGHELLEEGFEPGHGIAEIQGVPISPEHPVAAANVNPPHMVPVAGEGAAEPVVKPARIAL